MPKMPSPDYTYKAIIIRWVDGDTVYLKVDLGFRTTIETDFRVYGINTPERGQLNYKEATADANRLAPVGTEVTIQTYKDPEKYGRWLANIFTPDGIDVAQTIIADGLGVPYFGGTKTGAVG